MLDTQAYYLESALDYALTAAEHRERNRTMPYRRASPANRLDRSAHYFAADWHESAADTAWRCACADTAAVWTGAQS